MIDSVPRRRRGPFVALMVGGLAVGGFAVVVGSDVTPKALATKSGADEGLAKVKMFGPGGGDRAGIGSRGWFVDLDVDFRLPLEKTGYDPTQDRLRGDRCRQER